MNITKCEYISNSIVRRVQQPNVDLYPANNCTQKCIVSIMSHQLQMCKSNNCMCHMTITKCDQISISIVQQPNVDLYPANTVLQNALFVS